MLGQGMKPRLPGQTRFRHQLRVTGSVGIWLVGLEGRAGIRGRTISGVISA